MTAYKRWDVVLVPFPFTDFSTPKKRPTVIVSPDDYNSLEDVILMFITSNVDVPHKPGDYKIREWEKSGLLKPSMARMKFATIRKTIILRKIGALQTKDAKDLTKKITDFFS